MRVFSGFVGGLSKILDKFAGFFLISMVALIVANILLRVIVHKPFLGTYEYVSLFSAAMIGLALAQCAVKKGHIAVTLIVDKFSGKLEAFVDSAVNLTSFIFWGIASWYVVKYGLNLFTTGVVSPTTQIPFYPFVFLVAFGLFALCLVLFIHFIESAKRVIRQ